MSDSEALPTQRKDVGIQSHSTAIVAERHLCIGVVSKNVVAAAIDFARENEVEILLIASRRQVDLPSLGPGYVERWSAADLVEYVTRQAQASLPLVKLCRDHGGPWQNPTEADSEYDEHAALMSALNSLQADIDAGFTLLHLDTSVSPLGEVTHADAFERLLFLYERSVAYAAEANRVVAFEIGFEDQRATLSDPSEFESLLQEILNRIQLKGLPGPRFVVAQTGTKVAEAENIGLITDTAQRHRVLENLEAINRICASHGTRLKAHNCDYLDNESWSILHTAGVSAANVAPEYGVAETRGFLHVLQLADLPAMRDRFLQLAYDSGKWRKWLAQPSSADAFKCSVIAGHYVLSLPEVANMKAEAALRLSTSVDALDARLQDTVKSVIARHAAWFGLPLVAPIRQRDSLQAPGERAQS